jgi:hypothetical protein
MLDDPDRVYCRPRGAATVGYLDFRDRSVPGSATESELRRDARAQVGLDVRLEGLVRKIDIPPLVAEPDDALAA